MIKAYMYIHTVQLQIKPIVLFEYAHTVDELFRNKCMKSFIVIIFDYYVVTMTFQSCLSFRRLNCSFIANILSTLKSQFVPHAVRLLASFTLYAEPVLQAYLGRKWFDCAECHLEQETHSLQQNFDMVGI